MLTYEIKNSKYYSDRIEVVVAENIQDALSSKGYRAIKDITSNCCPGAYFVTCLNGKAEYGINVNCLEERKEIVISPDMRINNFLSKQLIEIDGREKYGLQKIPKRAITLLARINIGTVGLLMKMEEYEVAYINGLGHSTYYDMILALNNELRVDTKHYLKYGLWPGLEHFTKFGESWCGSWPI